MANKIGLLWCHSHVELRLIEVEVDRSLGMPSKKKVNFGTLAQKGGGGQSKIPNVDQY